MLSYKYYLNTVTRTVSKHTNYSQKQLVISILIGGFYIACLNNYMFRPLYRPSSGLTQYFAVWQCWFCVWLNFIYIYIFIGRFIPKKVTKQTPIKYTLKAVCVPVVNLVPNIFLIHSVF